MKPGYTIEYAEWFLTDSPAIIDCCNYGFLNIVKFYAWPNGCIIGLDHNTVAIFKIKPKSK